MKIAMAVHGRFHAFELAEALIRQGCELSLLTNYPRFVVEKSGVPGKRIQSFSRHGFLSKVANMAANAFHFPYPEKELHPMFSRWSARQIFRQHWDVIHGWSGVSEEIFRAVKNGSTLKTLLRGSSHITTQAGILEEEEKRTGMTLDKPTKWMTAREEREYELADRIFVLSTFARNSFVAEGISEKKLCLLPLGVRSGAFRPSPEIIEARCRRILSGEPLRVLFVGTLSFRKGMKDFLEMIRCLEGRPFEFCLVGAVTREMKEIMPELRRKARIVSKQPQPKLKSCYAWGDLFVFPTLEDGFAQVLAQAHAAALPILTTPNSSGPDFLEEGKSGWILPIRSPEAFAERLLWCHHHREDLAQNVRWIYKGAKIRTWENVASDMIDTLKLAIHGK